ncbi:MAG: cytochrome c3 family protein [Planctomycetaceae bacterium]|nr:cytochrome c3 family protein [Planctomycetaceae bacterium]
MNHRAPTTPAWMRATPNFGPLLLLFSSLAEFAGCRPQPPTATTKVAESITHEAAPHIVRPQPRPQGYVGSEVCRECHREIAERYAAHPMGRSASTIAAAPQIEAFAQPVVIAPNDFVYKAAKEAERQVHHEMLRGVDGSILYDQSVEMQFLIGSGQRGRSYLAQRGDYLVISPLTWYSHRGTWDMSPGYAKTLRHFERRAVDACLQCHVGRVASGSLNDSVVPPVFHEAAIGCERCHGPAEQHVARRRGRVDQDPLDSDPIVNPGRLDSPERDAVCNQCHLTGDERTLRYGRSDYDFRPGDDLSAVWVIFTKGNHGAAGSATTAVNHVPQMRSSRCYVASQGRMGCTSCHNPHGVPEPAEKVEYYRNQCLKCHTAQSTCKLADASRRIRQADDSCIACHMPKLPASDVPHTSQTDHRILRSHSLTQGAIDQSAGEQFALFDGMNERVPMVEIERARGLLMARFARELNDLLLATTAIEFLSSFRPPHDDIDVWRALGDLYSLQNRPDVAEEHWKRVLQTAPQDEFTLRSLGMLYHDGGRDSEAAELFARCLAINPWDRVAAGRMVHVLGRLDRFAEAKSLAEQTVAAFPWDSQLQEWLANAYAAEGRSADAERCRTICARLRRTH